MGRSSIPRRARRRSTESFGAVLAGPEFSGCLFVATKINTDGEASGIRQMRQNLRLVGSRTLDLLEVESLRDLDVRWPNVLRWGVLQAGLRARKENIGVEIPVLPPSTGASAVLFNIELTAA